MKRIASNSALSLKTKGADRATKREIETLARFCNMYCRSLHADRQRKRVQMKGVLALLPQQQAILCTECSRLFMHGAVKRTLCPMDPRPACSRCPAPCYAPGYRESMKRVMRYSGTRMVFRGRFDYLLKFLIKRG